MAFRTAQVMYMPADEKSPERVQRITAIAHGSLSELASVIAPLTPLGYADRNPPQSALHKLMRDR